MSISQHLLAELDHEMATTRAILARVPDKAATWKPHPKSMSMGELAQHIVNVLGLSDPVVKRAELNFADPATATYTSPKYQSTAALVEMFDRNVSTARTAIATASDETMRESWALRAGPKTIFSLPRAATLRSFILSHIIHHRGQLSVYLRINDVPLPPIYGPTADEGR